MSILTVGYQHSTHLFIPGLTNAGLVTENILRMGKPLNPLGYTNLKNVGIKTRIDLANINDEAQCKAAGIDYISWPMSELWPPTIDEIRDGVIRQYLMNKPLWPIAIGCKFGSDRTGLVMVCYRVMVCEDWDKAQAVEELRVFANPQFHFEAWPAIWHRIENDLKEGI